MSDRCASCGTECKGEIRQSRPVRFAWCGGAPCHVAIDDMEAPPSPAAPDPEAAKTRILDALADPRIRAGTHEAVAPGRIVISVLGGIVMEARWHDPPSHLRHDSGEWTTRRPAQLDLEDYDAVCEVRPIGKAKESSDA